MHFSRTLAGALVMTAFASIGQAGTATAQPRQERPITLARQGAFELLLRLWCARGLEQHSAEFLAPGLLWRGGIVLVSKGTGGTDTGKKTYGK